MFHAICSIIMVTGCAWAAVAHRYAGSRTAWRLSFVDFLMVLMCLAMADLAAGMLWPNETGTYLLPTWVWGAILMVSTPAMALGHRTFEAMPRRAERFLVLHRGASMAAMAILVFLAHGAHDHLSHGSGSHGGHDHAGPLTTVLSGGFAIGMMAYLGLSAVLTLLLMRKMGRGDAVASRIIIELHVEPTPVRLGDEMTAVPAIAIVDAQPSVAVARKAAAPSANVANHHAQLHEVLAQSIAVLAMLLMMF